MSAPAGIADHASTLAIDITRDSRWFGTIAWRRLPVLMLNRMPNPLAAAHSGSAAQYQRLQAQTIRQAHIIIRDVPDSGVKLKCLRKRQWSDPITTTLALPAANMAPI